jgi:hypothetical protein
MRNYRRRLAVLKLASWAYPGFRDFLEPSIDGLEAQLQNSKAVHRVMKAAGGADDCEVKSLRKPAHVELRLKPEWIWSALCA